MHLSVIIPAYNEETRIERTITEYLDLLRKAGGDFELIVEMDGCSDGTSEIVRRLASKNPEIVVLEFSERMGKGGGIKKGFERSKGEIVGFSDADCSIAPREFIKLLKVMEAGGYDGVISSRRAKGATIEVRPPLRRRVASRGFNLMVRVLFFLPYRDTQCGAKLFTRNALEDIFAGMKINGYAFDVDLLYQAKKRKLRIKEVGIRWNYAAESKLRVCHAISEMFMCTVKLRLHYLSLAAHGMDKRRVL